jgi:transcriptional regulator NrdR family protein
MALSSVNLHQTLLRRWTCKDCHTRFETKHDLHEHQSYLTERRQPASFAERVQAAQVAFRATLQSRPHAPV